MARYACVSIADSVRLCAPWRPCALPVRTLALASAAPSPCKVNLLNAACPSHAGASDTRIKH